MNFDNIYLPCSLDINVYKAYFTSDSQNSKNSPASLKAKPSLETDSKILEPKTLRLLALDKIVDNWIEMPIFNEITKQVDRNYVVDNLPMNIPLKISSVHIKDDFFWRKCYQHRWKTLPIDVGNRSWIDVYMEKHLQEYLENVNISDYDQESVQTILDISAGYIKRLEIDFLQPSMGEINDHIPLDIILSNLPDLRSLRVTYCTKTIETNFYLGCSSFSRNDITTFALGLSNCSELQEFWLHSVKLAPYQLALISKSLDKGCQNLKKLAVTHCAMHDDGLQQFLDGCTAESFPNLNILDLTNNLISPEGAFTLSQALKGRHLEQLILRLNPIESDGAAAILSVVQHLPLKDLDISGCSMTNTVTKILMQLIVQNATILNLDISNNILKESSGQKICKIIGFNKILRKLDLRNTGVTLDTKNKIMEVLKLNKYSS
ncbi:dynein regulatory complex subunit 5 [Eupeodes corollae]|uniref:dynein regulatory complex subunit 5 n=1 Tax=Eupeodes corollae TaxID=290404 RepID=UPI002491569B|nr:dynein regulatory complex subunit 5 [Eupeodes corollae]